MPYFYSHPNTNEFGKISVTPEQFFRRILRIGRYCIIPYVTNQEIEFTIELEKFPQRDGINVPRYNVYQRLGDGSYKVITTLKQDKTLVEGTADYTGDTKFFIASTSYTGRSMQKYIDKEGILLFDDHVLSINSYVWGGCSVTALLLILCSVLLSLLSGLIQVTPERVIWWPW
jgi:hypothetical protein